ncbi:histidinol dehydrogenase [Aliidiomarina maris]|uniref:Histidinol dehydrogenase n=3 Tax=Aliidiomarina maris TaxID=531312 RepID=A0A327X4K2_9GAMM|nr:histidinol dehydrogenase [Aliidiomarina maris]
MVNKAMPNNSQNTGNYTIAKAVMWSQLTSEQQRDALARPAQKASDELMTRVQDIIQQVRDQGEQALLALTAQFDGVQLDTVVLDITTVRAQADKTDADVKRAIDQAYANIKAFHAAQAPSPVRMETMPGVLCEQRFAPLEKVGLYIPGGSASLPSTVLMCGVPAQLAGCSERVLISPPNKEGLLSPAICYAALKCEVTKVCLGGGAQAIAALALGTENIPAVDKIVGPGNSYVTAAKQLVSQLPGGPAIDLPAGPSELLVIADDSADPIFVAADLLSQAEHGPDSQVLLLSPSARLVEATRQELERQLNALPRAQITAQALQSSSLIVTADLAEAAQISQRYAPEHLSLQIENAEDWIARTDKAGSIFVGHYAPESGGDYATGTNHVLPTYGYARNYSSLGLADFYRRYTVQNLTPQGLQDLAPTLIAMAAEEQLDAHLQAVALRLSSSRMQQDLAGEQS